MGHNDGWLDDPAFGTPGLLLQAGVDRTREISPFRVYHGSVRPVVANARVQFPNERVTQVRIIAEVVTAPPIYVGGSQVTAANGFPLRTVGQEVVLNVSRLGELYLLAGNLLDDVRYIGS